jgi:uncharacterized membrane protein (UPF0127 family)
MGLRLKWLAAFCLSLIIGANICVAANETISKAVIKFEIKKIQLAKKTLTVEVAESEPQHEYGLMFRQSLKKDHGMIFVFKDEDIRNFWMKDTIINLSIGYFDKNKTLIDIQEMAAVKPPMKVELPIYPSKKPAMYALEMSENWFKDNKISLGTTFKFVK